MDVFVVRHDGISYEKGFLYYRREKGFVRRELAFSQPDLEDDFSSGLTRWGFGECKRPAAGHRVRALELRSKVLLTLQMLILICIIVQFTLCEPNTLGERSWVLVSA